MCTRTLLSRERRVQNVPKKTVREHKLERPNLTEDCRTDSLLEFRQNLRGLSP